MSPVPSGPYAPTGDLVAVAWVGQRVPGLEAGMVATSLPSDVRAWADAGFVQARVVGGSPEVDIPVRHSLVQIDFWAATADAAGNVSAKPAWNKANRLAELVRSATETGQAHGQPVTLPAGYLGARVQAAYFLTEPSRVEDDPSGYAHLAADLMIDWVRA